MSRADLEGQRALEQLARAAKKLGGMFEARKEHLAAVSRSWWRGAEPEAAIQYVFFSSSRFWAVT